jgi:hypothetical protein
MVIFYSYVSLPEGKFHQIWEFGATLAVHPWDDDQSQLNKLLVV